MGFRSERAAAGLGPSGLNVENESVLSNGSIKQSFEYGAEAA